MSTKEEQAAKLLNNINVDAKQVGLGDYVVHGLEDLKATVKDKTFAGDNATDSADGLMSKEDKAKLDDIAEQANNYVLPEATGAAIGGVRQGVAVADAQGATPTAAEFKALLDSLRDAGIISES